MYFTIKIYLKRRNRNIWIHLIIRVYLLVYLTKYVNIVDIALLSKFGLKTYVL